MAEVVQEKSRGLKFAEQQLLRHGWEQGKTLRSLLCNSSTCSVSHWCRFIQPTLSSGKGLGRAENGISEAIKVKVKCDKGGVSDRFMQHFNTSLVHMCHWFGLDFIVCRKLLFVDKHDAFLHQVGHKEGEQFTFHWWDHVFNKASSSLQVQSDQVSSQSRTHNNLLNIKRGPVYKTVRRIHTKCLRAYK